MITIYIIHALIVIKIVKTYGLNKLKQLKHHLSNPPVRVSSSDKTNKEAFLMASLSNTFQVLISKP